MDRTNYALLSLVSIVAITAIIAMFLDARVPDAGLPAVSDAPAIVANAIFDVSVTGHVVAENPSVARNQPQLGNPYDLNGDGTLNAEDATTLGLVIDRVQFCPRGRTCDLNDDGLVDTTDLGLLNGKIIASARSQPSAAPAGAASSTRTARSVTASIGASGGIA